MTEAATIHQVATSELVEIGIVFLTLSAIGALLTAPVFHAALSELWDWFASRRMVTTIVASVFVAAGVGFIANADGQSHKWIHVGLAFAFGCGSHWLGPAFRRAGKAALDWMGRRFGSTPAPSDTPVGLDTNTRDDIANRVAEKLAEGDPDGGR